MKPVYLVTGAAALALGAWWLYTQTQAQADTTTALDTMDKLMIKTASVFGAWHPPEQYAGLIAAVEKRQGLPTDLLARQLYQESRYRPDIIDGSKKSPAGALGIAQFMPATAAQFGINPLSPAQSIEAAGKYMAQLFARFGNWSEALAAYNWGQGNVSRKGLDKAPAETVAYYTDILGDVNSANGTNYA